MSDTAKQVPEIRFKGYTNAWEQRKLGEIIERLKSYSLSRDVESDETTGYRYIHYGDIHKQVADMITCDEQLPYIKHGDYLSLNQGDLVLADASEDYTGIAEPCVILHEPNDKIIAGLHTIALRPKSASSLYLYYLLHTEDFKKFGGHVGTGLKVFGITFNNLSLYETWLPNLSEQKQIGDFFRAFDAAVTLRQRKLDGLRKLKKAYLQQMFPQAGEPAPQVRFAGFGGEWRERRLGEVMNVASVKRIHQSDWTTEGVRFLRARDIVSAAKNEEAEHIYISKQMYEEYSALSGKVAVGDILVTGVGTIGVPLLIKDLEPVYFKDGNIIWFKNDEKIDGEFFYYSFIGKAIQDFIKDSAGIGTVGTYTIESGKKTPIYLPEKIEQQAVGSFFTTLDNLITLHHCNLQKIKSIKKAYLKKMFI